jgi:hypothetical protein
MEDIKKYLTKILVGRPEAKRSFGRPNRIWEDNMAIYFDEIVCLVEGIVY